MMERSNVIMYARIQKFRFIAYGPLLQPEDQEYDLLVSVLIHPAPVLYSEQMSLQRRVIEE